MQGSFSPTLLKVARGVAGELAGKAKGTSQVATDVYLEDWWLLKRNGVDGISIGGLFAVIRRYDNLERENEHSTLPKLRSPSREFISTKVVKRHTSTEVETSNGVFVHLCGLINRSRSKENGCSFEVLSHFGYGFPLDWEDYASAESVSKSSQRNNDHFTEIIIPSALNTYSGAQLHDLLLALTDAEREILNKKMFDDVMAKFAETATEKFTELPSKPNPPPFVEDQILLTPVLSKAKMKTYRKVKTTPLKKDKRGEVSGLQTSRKRARK